MAGAVGAAGSVGGTPAGGLGVASSAQGEVLVVSVAGVERFPAWSYAWTLSV